MFDSKYVVQKLGGHTAGQQLGHGPDMVGHPSRHGWRDRPPAARRPTSPRRFGHGQRVPQALVWQNQMITGQREPQLLFQPGQLAALAACFARQPSVALAQREVFPFDKAGLIVVLVGEVCNCALIASGSPNTTLVVTATTLPRSRCLTTCA